MNKTAESVIVAVDFSHGVDTGVLIVGRQINGHMDIVNAFQGQEAMDIWEKLVANAPIGKAVEDN